MTVFIVHALAHPEEYQYNHVIRWHLNRYPDVGYHSPFFECHWIIFPIQKQRTMEGKKLLTNHLMILCCGKEVSYFDL